MSLGGTGKRLPKVGGKPLAAEGKRAKRKRPVRDFAYPIVARRANGGCEMPGCTRRQNPPDPHHTFGRGHLHGIPDGVCELPELILGLCRYHHDRIHVNGDRAVTETARIKAMVFFAERYALPFDGELHGEDAVDVMRDLVQMAGLAA